MTLRGLRSEIYQLSDPRKAKILARFFKTRKGEYGEGDVFVGITVPTSRSLAKKYKDLPPTDLENLLKSKIHEERLIALLILVHNYEINVYNKREKIYKFYLKFIHYINNWDLVDLTAPRIVGAHLLTKPKTTREKLLFRLVWSKSIWERRIAILATFEFIKNNQFGETLKIAELLLRDGHDLIHKAVGWMLREIGKRNQKIEEKFLSKHLQSMPRTTLRYAIERFENSKRLKYLRSSR